MNDTPAFQTEAMRRVLTKVYDLEFTHFSHGNTHVPVYRPRNIFAKKILTNAPFCFYDFVEPHACTEEQCSAVKETLQKYKTQNYIYKTTAILAGVSSVQSSVFSYIDARDMDAQTYFQGLSKNHHQNIRKAENKTLKNEHIVLRSASTLEEVNSVHDLFAYTYVHKHKMFFHPATLFIELYRNKSIKIHYALNTQVNIIMSAIVTIEDKNVLYYAWGMNLPEYAHYNLAIILLKNMILDAFSKGKQFISFGSSSPSDKKLLQNKAKWNCHETPVFNYYSNKAPNVIDLEYSFKTLRNIFFALPMPVLKKIMPSALKALVQ